MGLQPAASKGVQVRFYEIKVTICDKDDYSRESLKHWVEEKLNEDDCVCLSKVELREMALVELSDD